MRNGEKQTCVIGFPDALIELRILRSRFAVLLRDYNCSRNSRQTRRVEVARRRPGRGTSGWWTSRFPFTASSVEQEDHRRSTDDDDRQYRRHQSDHQNYSHDRWSKYCYIAFAGLDLGAEGPGHRLSTNRGPAPKRFNISLMIDAYENEQVYRVWCSRLHNHTLFIKKLRKKFGSVQILWVRALFIIVLVK